MASKLNRKSLSKSGRKKVGELESSKIFSTSPNPPFPFQNNLGPVAGPLFIAAALFCFFIKKEMRLGELFVFAAFIFQGINIYKEQKPSWMTWLLKFVSPIRGVGIISVLWLAFSLVILTFLNFAWLAPVWAPKIQGILEKIHQDPIWIAGLLFIGMVVAIRVAPNEIAPKDLSSFQARFCLFVILAVGVYLRLFDIAPPVGTYWDDTASNIACVRRVADLRDFQNAFIFPPCCPPIPPYTQIVMWWFMPDASSLFIQRLACVLWDLASLWMVYLVGKELAGRKLGVLAAALGAVSKPMIGKVVANYLMGPTYFFIGLAMLLTLRLIKKPSMKHFWQWGAAVGLGLFANPYFQPMIPYFVFILFFRFLLFAREKEKPNLFIWATAFVLLVYFLYFCNGFSNGSMLSKVVDVTGPTLACSAIGLMILLAFYRFPQKSSKGQFGLWVGWAMGAWLVAILSYPVLTNNAIFVRIQDNASNGSVGFLNGAFILQGIKNLFTTLGFLFIGGSDRADYNLPGDAFFSYSEVILIFLGLAFCFGKWNEKKAFILLTAFAGIMPHVLTVGPHSGRLICCQVPFLLIAGLGLSETLSLFYSRISKVLFAVLILIVMVFWGWSGMTVYSRVYTQWSENFFTKHVPEYYSSIPYIRDGYQIFVNDTLGGLTASTIHEGHPIHFWRDSNKVFLDPNEKFSGIVLYTDAESHSDTFRSKILTQFPGVHWDLIQDPKPYSTYEDYKCVIPASMIPDDSVTIQTSKRHLPVVIPPPITKVVVQKPYWQRQFASVQTGFTFGVLYWEDKVLNGTDPFPDAGEAVRLRTTIHVSESGKYEISCKADGRTDIRIDGKKIINMYFLKTGLYMAPPRTDNTTFQLEAGDHEVVATLCFQRNRSLPDVTLHLMDKSQEPKSLWTSFNW